MPGRRRKATREELEAQLAYQVKRHDVCFWALKDLLELKPYVTIPPVRWEDEYGRGKHSMNSTLHRLSAAHGGIIVVMHDEELCSVDYVEEWLDNIGRVLRSANTQIPEVQAQIEHFHAVRREVSAFHEKAKAEAQGEVANG